jgi:hypothetical protein
LLNPSFFRATAAQPSPRPSCAAHPGDYAKRGAARVAGRPRSRRARGWTAREATGAPHPQTLHAVASASLRQNPPLKPGQRYPAAPCDTSAGPPASPSPSCSTPLCLLPATSRAVDAIVGLRTGASGCGEGQSSAVCGRLVQSPIAAPTYRRRFLPRRRSWNRRWAPPIEDDHLARH